MVNNNSIFFHEAIVTQKEANLYHRITPSNKSVRISQVKVIGNAMNVWFDSTLVCAHDDVKTTDSQGINYAIDTLHSTVEKE